MIWVVLGWILGTELKKDSGAGQVLMILWVGIHVGGLLGMAVSHMV